MGGIFFHAAEVMAMALKARDRAAEERRADPRSMPSDALVSVVMAAAAAQAFINELGAYYDLERATDLENMQPRELACADALAEVEARKGSTEEKYVQASLALSDQMFDKGRQPFQNFSMLMKVRNGLVHPKALDTFDEGSRIMRPPVFVRYLEDLHFVAGRSLSLEDCVASGSLTPGAAQLLSRMIQAKLAFQISGGTGSGKTTFRL